jgi:glycosyltransferase involved in cell wall biosynthesis
VPRDVHGLAAALAEAIRNPELRARMAAANRDRIGLFDPEAVAREYLQALRHFAPDGV